MVENGWSDYLEAAKMVDDGFADLFVDPAASARDDGSEPVAQRDERRRLAERLHREDYLAVRTLAAARYRTALDTAIKGNGRKDLIAPDPNSIRGCTPG